jgi:hypothetical protein
MASIKVTKPWSNTEMVFCSDNTVDAMAMVPLFSYPNKCHSLSSEMKEYTVP